MNIVVPATRAISDVNVTTQALVDAIPGTLK